MLLGSIRRLWRHFQTDNLFRNSIYLMLTTGIMGGFGFFFWIICTHLFTPGQIGIGTTLISAMTLISFVSLLGFNSTFVRFLPTSEERNDEINTGSILVTATTAVISIGYILLVPYLTPDLAIISHNFWYAAGFVIMVTLAALNTLTDSIFVAYRKAQYNLITDGIVTSGTKLFLPFLFAGIGAYGIFAASGLAASLGMISSITLLIVKFNYRPELRIKLSVLKRVFHYSFTNYLVNLINMVPTLILPIIIINALGAPAAGYFYLAFMIIGLLYTVSGSVSQSLFAEGSYSEQALRGLIKNSVITLLTIMIPAVLVLVFFGPLVLQFFGKSYSQGGGTVIIILALAAPAVAAWNLGAVLLRLKHKMYSLLVINIIYAVTIAGLAIYLVPQGLTFIAIAWTIGNLVAAILAFGSLLIDA